MTGTAQADADPSIVGELVAQHPRRWSPAAIAAAKQLERDTRAPEFWIARLDGLEAVVSI